MNAFNPDQYGPVCARLLADVATCELGPGQPQEDRRPLLAQLDHPTLLDGRPLADPPMADCCISGLWLLHNFLDQSHELSQNIETTSGSYWHGIMHRREPDFSNAKYWFRRVAAHPVQQQLADALASRAGDSPHLARLTSGGRWDAAQFVDLCEQAWRGRDDHLHKLCCDVGWLEWQLLFDYCYQRACGQ
jgi:hypothetical protein